MSVSVVIHTLLQRFLWLQRYADQRLMWLPLIHVRRWDVRHSGRCVCARVCVCVCVCVRAMVVAIENLCA